MRFEALREAVPCAGRNQERTVARKTLGEPGCQNAAVNGRIRAAGGQKTEENEEADAARQCRLQEQGVVAAAHGVLAAVEAAVGQDGRKQA